MGLTIVKRQVAGVTILDLSGRITLGEGASTLRDSVREIVSEGHKKILLNLAEVSYIDSSGLGLLGSGYTTLNNQGGKLKLLNLVARVKDLLLITKLYTVFEVFDNEKSALHSFDGAPVG
jgi:anti-sigma B factor antagonist